MNRKKAGKIKELPDIVAVDNLSTRSKGEAAKEKIFYSGEAEGLFCLEFEGKRARVGMFCGREGNACGKQGW